MNKATLLKKKVNLYYKIKYFYLISLQYTSITNRLQINNKKTRTTVRGYLVDHQGFEPWTP